MAKIEGKVRATQAKRLGPARGAIRRYVITSAQNNTKVHSQLFENLQAFAEHYEAQLLVSTFSYKKESYGEKAVKRGKVHSDTQIVGDLQFDRALYPFIGDDGRNQADRRLELAHGLVLCGEMNILPTAVNPLEGLELYSGRSSGIFPHAKYALDSVASNKFEGTKFNYTTGVCTLRNYIQKKAGLKAERFHGYGGLFVEVDEDGDWFVRQLEAAEDGSFQDLDLMVENGVVSAGHPVEAIEWGDTHAALLDPEVEDLAWGSGGMLDALQPKFQFINDVFDMRARNHHERENAHRMFERFVENKDSVEKEVDVTARVLDRAVRDWCQTIVKKSNHDDALEKWLREADFRRDPTNALFHLQGNLALYSALAAGRSKDFLTIEWALRRANCPQSVTFLKEDESFVICHDKDGGIECGMHGHLGPNGSRGTFEGLAKMGRRANIGDKHRAVVKDGLWGCGESALKDKGWNKGPNSASHSHIITYPSSKRSMATMWKGKYRAPV